MLINCYSSPFLVFTVAGQLLQFSFAGVSLLLVNCYSSPFLVFLYCWSIVFCKLQFSFGGEFSCAYYFLNESITMTNDKETVFDFTDTTNAESEKWKTFSKDTVNQVMKSFGPISVLTDPDNLDDDDEPDSDLWGLKNMPQFEKYFTSDSNKTFNEFKKTWFQAQMSTYMTLDKSFRTSDCELVTKYSYTSLQSN